ncbi:hypothetical protein BH09DEP1_BH09DEP1_5340 [soil metagenome]
MDYFDEKIKFSEKNEKRSLYPLGILMAAELGFYDFAETFKDHPQRNMILVTTRLNFNMIIECMAVHSPQAMQEIKEAQDKINSQK